MVLTSDEAIFTHIEKLRDHGSIRKYAHEFPGYTGPDGLLGGGPRGQAATPGPMERTAPDRRRVVPHAVRRDARPVAAALDDADRVTTHHLFVVSATAGTSCSGTSPRGRLNRESLSRPLHLTPLRVAKQTGSFPGARRPPDSCLPRCFPS